MMKKCGSWCKTMNPMHDPRTSNSETGFLRGRGTLTDAAVWWPLSLSWNNASRSTERGSEFWMKKHLRVGEGENWTCVFAKSGSEIRECHSLETQLSRATCLMGNLSRTPRIKSRGRSLMLMLLLLLSMAMHVQVLGAGWVQGTLWFDEDYR